MTGWRLTGPAEQQMGEALAHSANQYGRSHAANYEALILAAMADVAEDYKRIGATSVRRSNGIWVYEITACHAISVSAIRGISSCTGLGRMESSRSLQSLAAPIHQLAPHVRRSFRAYSLDGSQGFAEVACKETYSFCGFSAAGAAAAGGTGLVTEAAVACGAGVFSIAPVIGMKNTPMSRREWILPSASLV